MEIKVRYKLLRVKECNDPDNNRKSIILYNSTQPYYTYDPITEENEFTSKEAALEYVVNNKDWHYSEFTILEIYHAIHQN